MYFYVYGKRLIDFLFKRAQRYSAHKIMWTPVQCAWPEVWRQWHHHDTSNVADNGESWC